MAENAQMVIKYSGRRSLFAAKSGPRVSKSWPRLHSVDNVVAEEQEGAHDSKCAACSEPT
uniref:Uncharacterized protein n=1 Tax=Anguilla anguilla TaxID=7936 RepID=A0A0E9XPB9_ANGAN